MIQAPPTSSADRHGIYLIEDNAHGLFGTHNGRLLGTFGTASTLSFHETENIVCGEGGALIINDPSHVDLARMMYEKGTNRRQFMDGLDDKYACVSLGVVLRPRRHPGGAAGRPASVARTDPGRALNGVAELLGPLVPGCR